LKSFHKKEFPLKSGNAEGTSSLASFAKENLLFRYFEGKNAAVKLKEDKESRPCRRAAE